MDTANFGDNRWHIVYGSYEGLEKKAVDFVYAAVSACVPYVLTLSRAVETPMTEFEQKNIVLIGTAANNGYVRQQLDALNLVLLKAEGGYLIKSTRGQGGRQVLMITAGHPAGVLYGAVEFCESYLEGAAFTGIHEPYMRPLFGAHMPEIEVVSAPKTALRGIWTWGHVMYDYRKFIDNMVRLRLNLVVIWNDVVPINAADVIGYAHENGIKVIWGYSWGWGEKYDISDADSLDKWAKAAVETYEREYAHLGGDGIYFQTFTETNSETLNGVSIAERVTEWVNVICGKLLKQHPNLTVQFGLHASSVKNGLPHIKNIDKRVDIVWEDGGAFPYAYLPHQTQGFDEACDFTRRITALRGEDERVGIIFKGLSALDWSNFEHQKGAFVLGESTAQFRKDRLAEKERIWKHVQAYWLENADYAGRLIGGLQQNAGAPLCLQMLVEDGMFEEAVFFPVALMAEMLWDSSRPTGVLMRNAALRASTHFANGGTTVKKDGQGGAQ